MTGDKILNPATGRMVLKTGKIGKQILAATAASKRSSKRTSKRRSASSKRVAAKKSTKRVSKRASKADQSVRFTMMFPDNDKIRPLTYIDENKHDIASRRLRSLAALRVRSETFDDDYKLPRSAKFSISTSPAGPKTPVPASVAYKDIPKFANDGGVVYVWAKGV